MIDTSTWKEFRVGELFSCETTLGIPSKNNLEDGDINYITRSATDNGFSGTCGNEDHRNKGNCITIGAEGFVAFWQSDDFVAGNKVYTLRHPNMNEINGLFVCSALNALSDRYSFADARVLDKIKIEIIKLPVTSDGQPDWDYMESYMCRIEEKAEKNLEALRKVKTESREIDTSEWGEFKIEDLFEKPVNTGNILAREVDDGSGTTPFVTASSINNGVTAYVDASKFDIIKGDCILVGGKTFTLTYQADDFISNDSHNFVMRLKHSASNYQYEYIVSVLRSSLSHIYSWGDAVTVKKIVNDKIKLPVAPSGEPDWAYMESYMKQMEEKAEKNLTGLICAGVEFDRGKAIA